jgi:hypothetical protein
MLTKRLSTGGGMLTTRNIVLAVVIILAAWTIWVLFAAFFSF